MKLMVRKGGTHPVIVVVGVVNVGDKLVEADRVTAAIQMVQRLLLLLLLHQGSESSIVAARRVTMVVAGVASESDTGWRGRQVPRCNERKQRRVAMPWFRSVVQIRVLIQ